MKNVSDRFKKLSKNIKKQDVKLTINDGEITAEEINIVPASIFNVTPTAVLKIKKQAIAKELRYSFEGKPFKTIMQQIEIIVKNASQIKDKNINFQYGILIDDTYEYIDMGDFFIKDIEDSKGKNEITATGYDNMIRFMKPFKQSELQLTYPCKMSKLTQRMGEVCGVELYSTNFFNSELDVDEDFFTAQELTYRDVLEKVAQATLTTAFIKENKLYFCKLGNEVVDSFDASFLSDIIINEKVGPVNALVLGRGDVEDNIESKDDESISTYGRNEIRFDENELVEYKREQVIDNMFEQIKGLEYHVFESSNIGIMWLEPCDFIELKDREENTYNSYYFKASITINTGIKGEMEAEAPSESNTGYKVTTKEEKRALKVERLAKKNEGLIQDLIEEIIDISDITTSKESLNGTVSFEKVNQSEPIYVKIYPTGENISYLYPSIGLFPSENLYLKARTLRFTNTTTNEYVDYELPTDLLYYDTENYDEFILDHKTQTCVVNKRVGYNADGTTCLLETPRTIEYEYPRIQLTDGDYTVTLLGYDNAYMLVKLMLQNIYTTQFATKVEVKSEISQTASGINSSVEKKLTKYTETEKLGTFIEQNWEYIKIAWNQISQYLKLEGIAGKATLNIYDQNNNMLMSLSQDGQKFYDTNGNEIGTIGVVREDSRDTLAFAMNVDWDSVNESKSMAWGYFDKKGKFLPVFHLVGTYGAETSEYGGKLAIEGGLSTESLEVIGNTIESGDTSFNIVDANGNTIFSADTSTPFFNLVNLILSYISDSGKQCIDFSDCVLTNMKNVPQTDENLNYISGSANSHIFASFKDGGSVIIFENSSDMNLKKNIKKSSHVALDKIKKIKHKEFDWKSNNKHQDIGYIAQEMKEIDESFVHYSKYKDQNGEEKENWQINTLSVLATVTKAIQEQNKEIEELKKKDKQKDEQINQLQNEINELKKERE